MTITDNMIEVVREAIYQPWMDADKATMRRISRDALTAAYPLIRAQVLEEAAKVCEKQPHFANKNMCATAIRNMAKDG